MGDEPKPQRKAEIPPVPAFCHEPGCQEEPKLVLAEIADDLGYRRYGVLEVFATDGKKRLPDLWRFVRWHTLCAHHADRILERHDWRGEAIREHARELGLTAGQKGENLSEYMRRHGIEPAGLRALQPVPLEDGERRRKAWEDRQ